MVLLGKTGTGKSRTGCNILNLPDIFPWKLQATSTTTKCEWKTANRFNRKIDVVDTPGIFDTKEENEDIQDEIKLCIVLTTPGPHAILLCVQMGKFTREDIDTVKHFLKYFGEELIKYVILVFTRADDWEREQHDKDTNMDIETYIQGLPEDLTKFLQKCNNRYILWNNRLEGSDMDSQVQRLLDKIDDMIQANNHSFYTNKDYERVEAELQSLLYKREPRDDVGIPIGTPAASFVSSVCSSLGYGNDVYSSIENCPGAPHTVRDQVKNSNAFFEAIKKLLDKLVKRMKDFHAWLWS